MKFLLINSTIKKISTGQIMYGIYKFLKANGHSVIYCYGRDNDPSNDKNLVKIENNLEMFLHGILSRLTGLQGYYSHNATKKLIRMLDNFAPDVVIIGNLHGYYVNYKTFLSELKRREILTYYYMFDEYAFLGKCAFFNYCDKYLSECRECPQKAEYPKSLFIDTSNRIFRDKMDIYSGFKTLRFTGVPYTVSKAVNSAIMKKSGAIVYDFGWGIDTQSIFIPHDASELRKIHCIPDEYIIILAVAPYSNLRKGIKQYYYEAAKRLKDKPIKFIHIGFDGNKVEIPENVVALSFVKDQKLLAQYFSLADLFVITSLSEGYPTVCLDSLCCGTPICGFNVSGVPFVAPSPFGEYVEPGDIEALTEKIAETQKKTPKMILACREYAIEHFDESKINKRVLEQIVRDLEDSKR